MSVEGKLQEIADLVLQPLENFLDGLRPDFVKSAYSKVAALTFELCSGRKDELVYRFLVNRVENYYSQKLNVSLSHLKGEGLLKEFVRHGNNQELMALFYKNQFEYLGRNYIQRNRVRAFEPLIKEMFQSVFYTGARAEIAQTILEMIVSDRDGTGKVDTMLLGQVIRIISTLGSRYLQFYEEDIESQFLHETRLYFREKAQSWMTTDSVSEYLNRVDGVMKEERARTERFLLSSTEGKLSLVLEREFLRDQIVHLIERDTTGFRYMLDQDRGEDMELLYRYVLRLGQGVESVIRIFSEYVVHRGTMLWIERKKKEEALLKEKASQSVLQEDVDFVASVLALYHHSLSLVEQRFQNSVKLQTAHRQAFVRVLNNPVEGVKVMFVEILSSYCDLCLKNSFKEKKTERELESSLSSSLILFTHLTDKDIFRSLYREGLATRLMNASSVSEDLERFTLAKLKLSCGQEFTSSMECMLFDLSHSKEEDKHFQDFYRHTIETQRETETEKRETETSLSLIPDFSVTVLTNGQWPSYQSFSEVKWPVQMRDCMSLFETYYHARHDGKRLRWIHELGSLFIRGVFKRDEAQRERAYTLQVVPLQAAVLLLLQSEIERRDRDRERERDVSLSEIMSHLSLSEEIVKRVLDSLCFAKFSLCLRRRPVSDGGRVSRKDDLFTLNTHFESRVARFKVSMPSLTVQKTGERVEEDRRFAIEACIVRIMKARKVLNHAQLMGEVLQQLQLFKPNQSAIRRAIEGLIEREYLSRDEDDRQVYKYLAEA